MRPLMCISVLVVAAAVLVSVCGCGPATPTAQMIQSSDAMERARGCHRAAQTSDASCIPLLVERLEDRDRAVRLMAHQALREMTHRDFGYRESDVDAARATAIARWREYARSRTKPGGGS